MMVCVINTVDVTDNNRKMEIKDILGIKSVADVGHEFAKATVDGVSSFLEIVCKPVLEEFGYLLRDKVRQWRLNNIIRTLEKAKGQKGFFSNDF